MRLLADNTNMKKVFSFLKPYLRWFILGGTLFFLLKAFTEHWQEVTAIRITSHQWLILAIAFGVTLLAFVWSAWVWYLILRYFRQPAKPGWALQVYLKTNIAKFIPGNVWHFYGRIWLVREAGISLAAATLSVLLEPLLMAAAASVIALSGGLLGWLTPVDGLYSKLPILGLGVILLGVHPCILNPLVTWLNRLKANKPASVSRKHRGAKNWHESVSNYESPREVEVLQLKGYPFIPLLGELIFILLRAVGFIIIMAAITTVHREQIPILFGVFSFAWLLGLVVPTPGGLGVFETTAIALLDQYFSAGTILTVVALSRLISTSAEASVAGLAWLTEKI